MSSPKEMTQDEAQIATNQPASAPIPIPVPKTTSTSPSSQSGHQQPQHHMAQSMAFSPPAPSPSNISPTHDSTSTSSSAKPIRTRTPSISLTILRAPTNTPIGPSHRINPFSSNDASNTSPPTPISPNRLAFSFSSPRPSNTSQSQSSTRVDSQINLLPLTSIQHQQILLPFLNRPIEVSDLLFNNPKTSILSKRLKSSLEEDGISTSDGHHSKWEEFKKIIQSSRRIDGQENQEKNHSKQSISLDDLEFLSKLEELLEPMDKDLWARLKSCLGADGLLEEFEYQIQPYGNFEIGKGLDYSDFHDSALDDEEEFETEITDASNVATIASSSAASSIDDEEQAYEIQTFDYSTPHSMDKILSSQFNLEPFSVQLPNETIGTRTQNLVSPLNTTSILPTSSGSHYFNSSSGSLDREMAPFSSLGRRMSRSSVLPDDMEDHQLEEETQVDMEPLTELPTSFGKSLPNYVTSSEKNQLQDSSRQEEKEDGSTSFEVDVSQPSSDLLGHGFSPLHAGGSHGGMAHVRSRSLSSGSSGAGSAGLTLSKIMEEEELGKKVGDAISEVASQLKEKNLLKEKEIEIEHQLEPERFAGLRITTTLPTSPTQVQSSSEKSGIKLDRKPFSGRSSNSDSTLSRSLSLGEGFSARSKEKVKPKVATPIKGQTQLPGGINFTKSRRLSNLFSGVEVSKPQTISEDLSSLESSQSPILPKRSKSGRSGSSSSYGSFSTEGGHSSKRRTSFVRSFAFLSPLSPTLNVTEGQDQALKKVSRHTRSSSERGTSSQPQYLPTSILSLDREKSSSKPELEIGSLSESFNIPSHQLLTPDRSRRVTFSTMEAATLQRASPPTISPLSSLKPLSPLRRTAKTLPYQSYPDLEVGSALASSSSSSVDDFEAISEHSSSEEQDLKGSRLSHQDISDRLDALDMESKLKLGLMRDGRTRHPSASSSHDVRRRSKSLTHSMTDLSQGGKEEIGIGSRLEESRMRDEGNKLEKVGEGERGRSRRMTVGHGNAKDRHNKIDIPAEEIEKFRRDFGIGLKESGGVKVSF